MKLKAIFFFANRLLFSKQKKTAISIMSWIAVLGMLVSSAAMVILLSVFNGIEGMIEGLYTEFDQEVMITPKGSKKMHLDSFQVVLNQTNKIAEIKNVSLFIQDRVILRKKKKWANAELWAVEPVFCAMANLYDSTHLINGTPNHLQTDAYIGVGLANKLALRSMNEEAEQLVIYLPRQDRKIRIGKNPFFQSTIQISGALDYNAELNEQTLVAPYEGIKDYFDGKVSGVLVSTSNENRAAVAERLKKYLSRNFLIQTNLEKNALIFKTSKSEKLVMILILVFVFILSLFNLSASLTMIYLEKTPQFNMMASLGMNETDLKHIFASLGFIIVAIGVLTGALLGCIIVGLHEWLALIKIPGSLKAFPSALLPTQVLVSVLLLVLLGISATWGTTSFLMRTRRIAK